MGDIIEFNLEDFQFCWDYRRDQAVCKISGTDSPFWRGSLLPSFHVFCGKETYADSLAGEAIEESPSRWKIPLSLGLLGSGSIVCEICIWGIRFQNLEVRWAEDTAIIGLYFGIKQLTQEQSLVVTSLEKPFWPCWRAEEYCVPCAGGSPTHSFWRRWDLGNASLPLGSFGPSMGTPYAAAFPRPLYACAMGGRQGWVAIGPGEIPNAALTLNIRASSSCLEYLYREDLWKAPDNRERRWDEPLRLTLAKEAYDAYARFFASLEVPAVEKAKHIRSISCTWGEFVKKHFDLRKAADYSAAFMPTNCLLIDDSWESFMGSGAPDPALFPHFDDDIRYIREKNIEVGLWQSIGWIQSPSSVGLDDRDLLCGQDGRPRLTSWLPDPHMPCGDLYYCLDPSSEKTRNFLRDRTRRIVREYDVSLLKLDFGYGLPGPDICTPHNPLMRGESLCRTLLDIIGEAAKEENPDITILFYGISPLMHGSYDLISLDDMGDCGDSPEYERAGHSQRCLWASLAAANGMAVNTSSGYYWSTLEDILLDTAVVGVNGSVLPKEDAGCESMTPARRRRWLAIHKWRRKATKWLPLWLDADLGGHGSEPKINSWARIEEVNGHKGIFAAALRGFAGKTGSFEQLPGIRFNGNWALISQCDNDIFHCKTLALIPFAKGSIHVEGKFQKIAMITIDDSGVEKEILCKGNPSEAVLTASSENSVRILGYLLYR